MTDWCLTEIAFYAESKKGQKQLTDFYDKLIGFENSRRFSDVGKTFGLSEEDFEKMCLRGLIYPGGVFCDEDAGCVYVDTETACGPQNDIWDELIRRFFPELKYVYIAEERECDVYINTDTKGRFFKHKYMFDYDYEGGCEQKYFNSEEELLEFGNSLFGSSAASFEELCKAGREWEEADEFVRRWVNIHEFEPE